MAQIFEQSLEDISAKLTQMEGTVRQMSDDQFIVNLGIGQVGDAAVGNATGSINAHARGMNAVLGATTDEGAFDEDATINAHLRGLNIQNSSLSSTLGGIEASASAINAKILAAGFYLETTGVIAAGVTATVDMSAFPSSKFAIRVFTVGDASAWSVTLEGDLTNSFIGNNTVLQTHNTATGTGVTLFVVDKPVRYMRARTSSVTRTTGSITIDIFAMP